MLDGHYETYDVTDAHKMTVKAIEKGSDLGAAAFLRRLVFGDNYIIANPKRAVELVKDLIPNESDDIAEVNPVFYEILGDAHEKLGDKEKAGNYYMKAIGMGYYEAYGSYYFLKNENLETEELEQQYLDLLSDACKSGDPSCFIYKAAFLMDKFNSYDTEKQQRISEEIKADLETGAKLGSRIAPYFLGNAYYYANYGFKKDNNTAWDWFIEGTKRDDGDSYSMIAIMISAGDNPYEVSEGLVEHCSIMSLRNECNDLLELVVESYRNGELADYAVEIEKYYIPRYEDRLKENDDDVADTDDDDSGYNLIAIVKTDGSADIIEFDVEAGWNELPELVGATRLDAIRTQPLYDVSKVAGYTTDHVTGWVDNMGLMKDLMMNRIGCQIYPGPIAGDIILTLEDAKYNPKSFRSLDRLKKAVVALGANSVSVNLDDGPDDDGRYDAWS